MNIEFGLRPLVAGSLVGVRSWRVTDSGVLTGVSHRIAWDTGENQAQCASPMREFALALARSLNSFEQFGYTMQALSAQMQGRVFLRKPPKPKPAPAAKPERHEVSLACSCGFYAYFDRKPNSYHKDGMVVGLIEGYGNVVVGSRGFRAGKARIVALIDPPIDVMATYPDARRFPTLGAAVAAFPLVPPPALEVTQ